MFDDFEPKRESGRGIDPYDFAMMVGKLAAQVGVSTPVIMTSLAVMTDAAINAFADGNEKMFNECKKMFNTALKFGEED